MQGLADPRPAGPIRDRARHSRERGVRAALAQLTRDARQPRSEREGLDASPLARQGVRHVEEKTRIGLHRTGDIAEDHERPALWSRRTPQEHGGLAERAERPPQRGARVEPRAAARRPEPSARAFTPRPAKAFEESRRRPAVVPAQPPEVDSAPKLSP